MYLIDHQKKSTDYPKGDQMDQNQKELQKFLEQQLQWTKEQVSILNVIDEKLHEMKEIAQYVVDEKGTIKSCNQ